MYSFIIKKPDGRTKIVERSTLAEALRSRHAYKKSPHFRGSLISLVSSSSERGRNQPTLADVFQLKRRWK